MKKNAKTLALKMLKSVSDKHVRDTVSGRCRWWMYEPKIPNAVKKMKKEKNINKLSQ